MAKKVESTLVIVESPTKARTMRRFLGSGYTIESCMGHVRDLPQSAKDIPEKFKKKPWARLGVNVEKNFEPLYCVPKNKSKVISQLKTKLKAADVLILATDEDREGESISWHLCEILKPKVPVQRMVFHEITSRAIKAALKDTREVNKSLVRAQEARRILDRLVGYTISPLLWKKVSFGLSAGRVQSVALRLTCEREHERLKFIKAIYAGLKAQLSKSKIDFEATLTRLKNKKIATGKDFDPRTGKLIAGKTPVLHLKQKEAIQLAKTIATQTWKVTKVDTRPTMRHPGPPFITSTLQQAANRQLRLSARETMQVAQKLYENGLITYMRTDSTTLSSQALQAARASITKLYGKQYVPDAPRTYAGKKVKGAQEAHEAIRPAGDSFVEPKNSKLSGVQLALYDLIWRRTLASQMKSAQLLQTSLVFEAGEAEFSASGLVVKFAGFLKVYSEADETRERRLPTFKVGDTLKCNQAEAQQHETKPVARFTEASLIQTLEKEGVGRPSTYASIISTIQDRGYVAKQGTQLVPTFTALIVNRLLSTYLPDYVDLAFTSKMEQSLDDIAQGDLEWVTYLNSIYFGTKKLKSTPARLGLKQQVEQQEKKIDSKDSRGIVLDNLKGLVFRVGRYGAYVCRDNKGQQECASLPMNQFPGSITEDVAHQLIEQKINGSDALGHDPKTGLPIFVLNGPYGPYVQLGDASGDDAKPKRSSIPANIEPEQVNLKQALQLLQLPMNLGAHEGKDVKKGIGRFGPYVVRDGDFRSIPKAENIFDVDLARAVELLSQPKAGRGRAAALKQLGEHPKMKKPVALFNGKYGPYVKCGAKNASLPDGMEPKSITLAQACKLIDDKVAKKRTSR